MSVVSRSKYARLAALCAAVWICLFSRVLSAQQLNLKMYGQEQGLSNLVVRTLFQDRTNFLWVGTQSGLFRYDGSAFRNFAESSLPSAWIVDIHQTSGGALWVATRAGVVRLVGDHFEALPIGDYEIVGGGTLSSDSAGTLYVATTKGLLAVKSSDSRTAPQAEWLNIGVSTGPVLGAYVDPQGWLWLGCHNRVYRVDIRSPAVTGQRPFVSFGRGNGIPDGSWSAIIADPQGNTWFRSSEHLMMLPHGGGRFVLNDQGLPNSTYDNGVLRLDRKGRLLMPTDLGLLVRDHDRWERIDISRGLAANAVGSVLEDREGSRWIGLSGVGLARWVGADEWESWTHVDGLSNEAVWSIRRDGSGTIWAGTDYGLNYLRKGERVWHQWKGGGLDRAMVRALAVGREGNLWLSVGANTVAALDTKSQSMVRYGAESGLPRDKAMSMALDRAGSLWVATRGGLYRSKGSARLLRFERQFPPGEREPENFTQVIVGHDGAIFATGALGLAIYRAGKWTRWTTRDGLRGNKVSYVAEAPDGSIWITYRERKGFSNLAFQNGTLRIQDFTSHDGPRSDHTVFVRNDARGQVWFGSDSGVDVYDGHVWRHYGQGDGLVWDDCDADSFLDDSDGGVWIGTSRGISHFRPLNSAVLPEAPVSSITAVTFGGKSVDPATNPEVRFQDRSMQVQFTALTYLNEHEVRFRYRLVDLQKEWTETAQHVVDYPGLGQGNYVFEVVARNARGVWGEAPAQLRFRILPRWWTTWWFDAGVLIALGAGAWQMWKARVRRLLDRHQKLETAVAARTRELVREKATVELQNQEIERLLEQSQQASRAKSAFLANMSHEIRTPLNGVFGMTELVLATELTGEQRECLETVKDSAGGLLCILNDVLDLSKVEAGRMELEFVPFSPRNLLQECSRLFRPQTAQRSLTIQLEIEDAVPETLEGDPVRLRQVLLNLLGNAVKFTSVGGITLRVKLDPDQTAAGFMRLHWTVEDTGIGIPEDKRTLIFEAFRQADSSTTRKYGGTGLGLAISSQIVRLMSGRIWVESEFGAGSAFHFDTLLGHAAAFPGNSTGVARLAGAVMQAERLHRPLAILLAEDNPINQKLAMALLTKRGHIVTLAGNGIEAVARALANPFDVILMDVHMPEMDGIEATRLIREARLPAGNHIPIIAMTACAMAGDRERCLTAGMDDYLEKPVNSAKLLKVVEALSGASPP